MDTRRILYFNHDNPHPSGGVRTIYSHVQHLNRHNIPAYVVHLKTGFMPDWFHETVPTLYYDYGLDLTTGDVLVIPEDLRILAPLKSAAIPKIIFCQNHFNAFSALPPGETWRSLGVTHVLASSGVIADFLRKHVDVPDVTVVNYAIDPIFKPAEKKLQIAFMPRKGPMEASFIYGLFGALGGAASSVTWVEINGLPPERVAALLGESAIFLSLSKLEGFGLPPVEAMASGCVVVGYHGYGGLEYATAENGFWCEEGNPMACVKMLRDVVERFQRNDPTLRTIIEAGMKMAARYTAARQEAEIVAFMHGILAQTT